MHFNDNGNGLSVDRSIVHKHPFKMIELESCIVYQWPNNYQMVETGIDDCFNFGKCLDI